MQDRTIKRVSVVAWAASVAAMALWPATPIFGAAAASRELTDDIRRSETAQLQIKGQTQKAGEELSAIIAELNRNGIGGEDVKILTQIQGILGTLSDKDMGKVVALLQEARNVVDPSQLREHVTEAVVDQKQIIVKMRQLLLEYQRQQKLYELSLRFTQLAERQNLNLKEAKGLVKSTQGAPPERYNEIQKSNRSLQAGEEEAIRDETRNSMTMLRQLAQEAETDTADRLKKSLAGAEQGKLEPSLQAATDNLKNGFLMRAAGDERIARDRLYELARLVIPDQDTLAKLRRAAESLEKAIAEEKIVIAQTMDLDAKKVDIERAGLIEDRQADNVDRTDRLRKDINLIAPEVEKILDGAQNKMQETRQQLNDRQRDPAIAREQDALAQLNLARKALLDQIAQANEEKIKGTQEEQARQLKEQVAALRKDQETLLADTTGATARNASELNKRELQLEQRAHDLQVQAVGVSVPAAGEISAAGKDMDRAAITLQKPAIPESQSTERSAIDHLLAAEKLLDDRIAKLEDEKTDLEKLEAAREKVTKLIKDEQKVALDTAKAAAKEEAPKTEDAKRETAKNDPAKKDDTARPDATKNDEAKTDPAKNDTAKADPKADAPKPEAKNDPAKSDPKNDTAKADPAKNDPAKNDPSKADPAKNETAKNDPKKDPSKNDTAKNDQAKNDQAKNDQAKNDQAKNDTAKNDAPKNPDAAKERQPDAKEIAKQQDAVAKDTDEAKKSLPESGKEASQPLDNAKKEMTAAKNNLDKNQPKDAAPKQNEAIAQLNKAKNALDDKIKELQKDLGTPPTDAAQLDKVADQLDKAQKEIAKAQSQLANPTQELAKKQKDLAKAVEQAAKESPDSPELKKAEEATEQAATDLKADQVPNAVKSMQKAQDALKEAQKKQTAKADAKKPEGAPKDPAQKDPAQKDPTAKADAPKADAPKPDAGQLADQQAEVQKAAEQIMAQGKPEDAASELGKAAGDVSDAQAEAKGALPPSAQQALADAQKALNKAAGQANAGQKPEAGENAAKAQAAIAQAQAAVALAQQGMQTGQLAQADPGKGEDPGQGEQPGDKGDAQGQGEGEGKGDKPGQGKKPGPTDENKAKQGNGDRKDTNANAGTGGSRGNVAGKSTYLSLPARDRDAIQQTQKAKYPEEYGPAIEQYLKNLSDQENR